MARIALLSDIHGNAEALERVLDDLSTVNAELVVCLGDVVGYGPDPERCVELVYEHCDVCVLGNHDEAILVEAATDYFNDQARRALDYTRDRLDDWHLTMLKLMPYRTIRADVGFAHGSFGAARFDYLYSAEAAARSFEGFDQAIGCVGHTHLPSYFTCVEADGALADESGMQVRAFPIGGASRVRLTGGDRVIVNPGSVGQPRDRNPDASWGVLDTDEGWFEVRRVRYDVDAVGALMEAAGLPEVHRHRLRVGA